MTTDSEILEQLKKINHRLTQITSTKRRVAQDFVSGLFRSIGYAIGTSVVVLISVYFLSKMNLGEVINNYVKQIIPKPTQTSETFSQPVPDQL